MIRTTRLCVRGKNYLNFPLFTQRAVTLPKQIFLEFSIDADQKTQSANQHREEKKLESFVSENSVDDYGKFPGEINYSFFRDFFNTGLKKNSNFFLKDSVVKNFFNEVSSLTPSEIIKVLKLISQTNTRPKIYIKALCDLLPPQENWKYTVSECADLLYYLSKLSYKHNEVIKLVADRLVELNAYHSPRTAGCILHSLADLRYRDCELIDRLLKFTLNFSHSVKTSLHCLRGASLLNYYSNEVEQIMQNLSKLEETDFVQSTDYVDFIWACVILNKQNSIDMKHLSNILSRNYVKRLIDNGAHRSLQWKLLNINGAARQMVSYNGPLLNKESFYSMMSLGIMDQRTLFLESVLDVLSHLVPKSGLIKPLVNTGAGFYLDFEYIEDVSKAKNSNYSKTGLILLNFNDICSDGTISGLANFKINLLTSMGYKIVMLRFSEYNHSAPLSAKIELIRKKINSIGAKCVVDSLNQEVHQKN